MGVASSQPSKNNCCCSQCAGFPPPVPTWKPASRVVPSGLPGLTWKPASLQMHTQTTHKMYTNTNINAHVNCTPNVRIRTQIQTQLYRQANDNTHKYNARTTQRPTNPPLILCLFNTLPECSVLG